MITKIHLSGALAAALLSVAAVGPSKAALPILGTNLSVDGTVTAFDLPRNTITVGNDTYYIQSPHDMDYIQTGEKVRIDYVVNDNKRWGLGVTILDPDEKQAMKDGVTPHNDRPAD